MIKTIVSVALFVLPLVSCGGESGSAAKRVSLTANDQMQFSAKAFSVKVGQKLEIDFQNVGKMPKESMGHNLIILNPGVDPTQFGVAAVQAKDNDYIPADRASDIIVHSKLLGPGEKDLVVFEPTKAGEYPFLCSFPGHVALMKGVIAVVP